MADVARAVVTCLQKPDTIGQTYELCGPDVLTLGQLVRLAGRHGSTERPILPLPMAIGRLQAFMMELAPGEPLMSRDNLAAMSVDNVATGQNPGLQALGIVPARVEAIAPSYLGDRGGRSALLQARQGAGRR